MISSFSLAFQNPSQPVDSLGKKDEFLQLSNNQLTLLCATERTGKQRPHTAKGKYQQRKGKFF
jgi:hypothetical protein